MEGAVGGVDGKVHRGRVDRDVPLLVAGCDVVFLAELLAEGDTLLGEVGVVVEELDDEDAVVVRLDLHVDFARSVVVFGVGVEHDHSLATLNSKRSLLLRSNIICLSIFDIYGRELFT